MPAQIELAAPNICGGLAGPARGLPNDWHSALLEAPLRERFHHCG
jgi:glucokinase